MISATVIKDSISPQNHRLTTFELRYPKFIHGEFMTHRVFSRNASSSRAIPTRKLLEEVRGDDRAGPLSWGKNQKGMQAGDDLTGMDLGNAQLGWALAAKQAADWAERLMDYGVHKQIANRVIEPFLHINVVASATEYMNFFGLRLDKAAQPEMRLLAETMWRVYNDSQPKQLRPGYWHLPYVDEEEDLRHVLALRPDITGDEMEHFAIQISVARCARVSYRNFETGQRSTLADDLQLYQRLVGSHPMHASPAEHQATPDYMIGGDDPQAWKEWDHPHEHGNFTGWRQFRKMLPGEALAPLPAEIPIV